MSMALPLYHTAAMVRARPADGNRCETVHGELFVTPAPRAWHQEVVFRIGRYLAAYCQAHGCGHAMLSPSDISWGEDILVQPDAFVVDLGQARSLEWSHMTNLLVVVEVLSPSSARADRFAKRRLYQEVGVPRYWLVDADARVVEVWKAGSTFPRLERDALRWHAPSAPEPLVIPLAELFRPI